MKEQNKNLHRSILHGEHREGWPVLSDEQARAYAATIGKFKLARTKQEEKKYGS